MLFVWIALWIVALILLLADPRSPVNRRLGAVCLSGGAGALASTLADVFIPYLHANRPHERLEELLYAVQAGSSLFCYYGLPYFYLLFAMAYNPSERLRRWRRRIELALLLPILLCLLFTPPYNEYHPITYSIVVWWAIPYFLAATFIFVTKKFRHYSLSHTHWVICLAVLPPVLFTMTVSYVLPSFGIFKMWKYNTWLVGIAVFVFLIGLFSYGFMGLRVLIDRRRLDSTLRAVTSGTAILHHAIKNDVGKMRLFTEKMKAYADSTGQAELAEDIQVVQQASRHIQEMIARVHRRTEDLEIQPSEVRLDELLQGTLKPYEPLLGSIKLHLNVAEGWRCTIDSAQVGEAINNLVSNAIEAMNGAGQLFVSLREGKKELTVEVRDTGDGMDKAQAAKALEPFYTTKSGKEANFGLGLPYAYHVMRKHGGYLQIRSKQGIGTRVYLIFPKSNVNAVHVAAPPKKRPAEGSEAHGTRSGMDN